MKKTILLLTVLTLGFLSSCSDDDDNNNIAPTPTNTLSGKFDGVQKNFTVTSVDVMEYPEYTDLEITAVAVGDPTRVFEMNLTRDNGEPYFIQYNDNGTYYQSIGGSLSVGLSENVAGKLKGTFTGTMLLSDGSEISIPVTDGVFDITY